MSITMRWTGNPVAHSIEVMVGEHRVFITLHNTGKAQSVSVLGGKKPAGGSVAGQDQFHTWKLVWRPDGQTELYADDQKVAEGFPLLKIPKRPTGSFGIGGVHGTGKERMGRLEITSASFEVLKPLTEE